MFVIFGGSGFVGTALRRMLDREGVAYFAPDFDLCRIDSKDWVRDAVNDGDTLVMLAAYTHEHGKPHRLAELNVRMAASVIEGIEGKQLQHCVYISSDSVYGVSDSVITESTPVCPNTVYGHMHALREQMFKDRFPELTILRPCAIYGKGDTHNAYGINQFVKTATEEGQITLFGEGEEMRSNVHVDDVAAVIAKSARDKISGVFNVNCGRAYSFMQLAEIIGGNGVRILSKPRTQPVTHRLVDNSLLVAKFMPMRTAHQGIAEMME